MYSDVKYKMLLNMYFAYLSRNYLQDISIKLLYVV